MCCYLDYTNFCPLKIFVERVQILSHCQSLAQDTTSMQNNLCILPLVVYQDLELHHNFYHVLSYPNNLQNINYRLEKITYFENL